MGESSEIHSLVSALNRLSLAVERASSSVEGPEEAAAGEDWEVVQDDPFGSAFASRVASVRFGD